uniref:Ig-like domain-containing protein n=1 Tax=Cyprinodon variegatus TaxID=28743 RepID=A0A3Q2FQJ6_CYPVA
MTVNSILSSHKYVEIPFSLCSENTYTVFNLMLSPADVKCEQLTQPASMSVQPGQTLTISCQVSYSVTSHHTGWIRQLTGKEPEWMGVIWHNGGKVYASRFQGRIEINRDTNKNMVNLRLSSMKPEDSAVYYCARETLWLMKAERLYKNSEQKTGHGSLFHTVIEKLSLDHLQHQHVLYSSAAAGC